MLAMLNTRFFIALFLPAVMVFVVDVDFAPAQRRAAKTGTRKLAPGVMTTIPSEVQDDETFSGPREIVELSVGAPQLSWQPNLSAESETLLARVKTTIFRRNIWALEFSFKPLSMIQVDLEQPDGTVKPQTVWYLVYNVRNNGKHLSPSPVPDESGRNTYAVEPVDHTIRFFPNFLLQCHDVDRVYLDKVMPTAVAAIRQREDPNRKLYNSVSISDVNIPISSELEDKSVWGVATWVNVDPRSDFFSIYVRGLTNAYQWQDPADGFKAGDSPGTGRRFLFKTLQLNFWRPGDAINPTESEFRFGVPNQSQVPAGKTEDDILKLYGLKERVDYQWVYR
ncbi:MAG: hypothetical protein P8N76_02590 [Pirellulaceae bacterium]|nr:hypothetical protein [Pirellulaceae bacterium]